MQSSTDSLSVLPSSKGSSSTVLLTPGRTRNIAQDMEALRLSRQDNPYLQQIMASRESLIESHSNECEADDTILMSQEFGSTALDFAEDDPITLKEVHDHMIRSPPPTNCWPQDSLSYRAASAFDFSVDSPMSYSACSVNIQEKECRSARSVGRGAAWGAGRGGGGAGGGGGAAGGGGRPRTSRSASPRHDADRPLSLPGESHLRSALRKKGTPESERFSLLQHPRPLRSLTHTYKHEDNVQLVNEYEH